MSRSIPEKDWKQLRKLKPEMLNTLCLRINKKAEEIIQTPEKSEHEKYIDLYEHIQESDDVVARCFNDWRRSNIWIKFHALLREGLLTDKHVMSLSDESEERFQNIKDDVEID